MLRGVVVVLSLVCAFTLGPSSSLHAKGMYVRDWIVITLRTAPNETSQAVGSANTNDLVEVLEEGDGWTRIQTKDGKDGWVASRFLSTQPPRTLFVKQLEDRIKALQDENLRLKGLAASRTSGGVVPPSAMQQGVRIPPEIAFGNCTELKQGYDKLLGESQECSRKMMSLTTENDRLKTSERLIFTFVGGVFILLGVIIGLFVQVVRARQKKQGYRF